MKCICYIYTFLYIKCIVVALEEVKVQMQCYFVRRDIIGQLSVLPRCGLLTNKDSSCMFVAQQCWQSGL